ncbi:hypothetical protein NDU88_001750 [Pleurodeles waltl]|uniref:Uncharacterized protein n=1 Tax=Pleurodeles waltl TaxID=8319 RepID=A0AAV7NGM3_PLEWA|nr:hypothetical protein NDU88_001750 [Pleurodeles waltl]
MRHLQMQPKTQEFQLRPKPGSASPLTTGTPAFTELRPERASPLQQAGYLLRPDLAGDIPQAAKAGCQPNRVRHAAISPCRPPQAHPEHPATQQAAGRQALVPPPRLGPIRGLRFGSAPQVPSPPGVRPQLSRSAGLWQVRRPAYMVLPCFSTVQAPPRPRSDLTPEGLGSWGPDAPHQTLPFPGSRDAPRGGPPSGRAPREEELAVLMLRCAARPHSLQSRGKTPQPAVTGARHWNRSGTRGSKGPQRKPTARSVARRRNERIKALSPSELHTATATLPAGQATPPRNSTLVASFGRSFVPGINTI